MSSLTNDTVCNAIGTNGINVSNILQQIMQTKRVLVVFQLIGKSNTIGRQIPFKVLPMVHW